jgi:hypothetical protein
MIHHGLHGPIHHGFAGLSWIFFEFETMLSTELFKIIENNIV